MLKEFTSSIKNLGFIQALGVLVYCSLVGLLMWKGNTLFGKDADYFAPVTVLMLFSVSALICGLIVFYQPYVLFFDGKKKEAASLVLHTSAWLFLFLLFFLAFAIIF